MYEIQICQYTNVRSRVSPLPRDVNASDIATRLCCTIATRASKRASRRERSPNKSIVNLLFHIGESRERAAHRERDVCCVRSRSPSPPPIRCRVSETSLRCVLRSLTSARRCRWGCPQFFCSHRSHSAQRVQHDWHGAHKNRCNAPTKKKKNTNTYTALVAHVSCAHRQLEPAQQTSTDFHINSYAKRQAEPTGARWITTSTSTSSTDCRTLRSTIDKLNAISIT